MSFDLASSSLAKLSYLDDFSSEEIISAVNDDFFYPLSLFLFLSFNVGKDLPYYVRQDQ